MESAPLGGYQTLLQKYEIPVEHLDFDYLRTCNNVREVERIVRILRSHEEGYFPDLQKFAEDRLKELCPKSKLLRSECEALRKEALPKDELDELTSWQSNAKVNDVLLRRSKEEADSAERNLPPVRAVNKNLKTQEAKVSSGERIKSSEYDKWDKFDADAESLKIDLDDERRIEFVKRQNKKNALKSIVEEIYDDDPASFSQKEREQIAIRCKDNGNDCFRAKEFEEAFEEYDKSIKLHPTAAAFNNRAITCIKLHRFKQAISDVDECLKLEPTNIKALHRKAQALLGEDRKKDAYEVLCKILNLQPSDSVALGQINDLRKQLPDLPPPNATRIKIVNHSSENETKMALKKEMSKVTVAEPTKVSQSKQEAALQNFRKSIQKKRTAKQEFKENLSRMMSDEVILLPHHDPLQKKEFLIQESTSSNVQ